jgi:hypothetical protein
MLGARIIRRQRIWYADRLTRAVREFLKTLISPGTRIQSGILLPYNIHYMYVPLENRSYKILIWERKPDVPEWPDDPDAA